MNHSPVCKKKPSRISPTVLAYLLRNCCFKFGEYNPRMHGCIRGVEGSWDWCILCKGEAQR